MTPRGGLSLLTAGAVLFGAAVAVELILGPPPTDLAPVAAAAPASAAAPKPAADAATGDALATVLARPMFSATRRPPPQAAAEAAASGDLANARLTAILIAPDRRIAVFAVPQGKPLELGEGDSLFGERIEAIALHEVSLSGPDGVKTLQPKPDPNLLPAATPASPPQRPAVPPPAVPAAAAAPPRDLARPMIGRGVPPNGQRQQR